MNKILLVAGAALLPLAACGEGDTIVVAEPPAVTLAPLDEMSDQAELEIAMLDHLWYEQGHGETLCEGYLSLGGVGGLYTDERAVSDFEAGAGQRLTPEGRDHFLDLLHAC